MAAVAIYIYIYIYIQDIFPDETLPFFPSTISLPLFCSCPLDGFMFHAFHIFLYLSNDVKCNHVNEIIENNVTFNHSTN